MVDFSPTPDIISFSSHNKIEIMGPKEIDKLKKASYQLMAEVGVCYPSEVALKIFADHGADVDWDTSIVRIPPDLVDKAMATAPRDFVLGGREPRFDLTLDGSRSYMTTDGCGVHVVDLETREKRSSRKSDVAMMARVADAIPFVSFFWPMVSAQDHGITAPLHECHAGLTSTLKHVRGGTTVYPELAPYVVEMATVVSGSDAERRKRPPICANICGIAPLSHDGHGIETALIFAEAGIPSSFMAMPNMGSTAPASVMGAIIQGDAESVSAMVLMQLAYPGAPVFHSIITSLMDPRTGGYIGDTPLPVNFLAVQMAHAWGVPSLGGGSFSSDSPDIGWQSAFEAGFGASQIPPAGGDLCGYMGLMDSSMTIYHEQIMLDAEIARNVYETYKTREVEDLESTLDVIKEVGPQGHYMRQKHTRSHIRDFHFSPIFDQHDQDGNLREPREIALEQFKELEKNHHPEPLPEPTLKELDRILAAADKTASELGS